MAYNQDLELALRLLLADLDALEEQQKGKQAAGELTDAEHAIAAMRNEVLNLRDHIEAVSTSTAIATDHAILTSMARDEEIASQDHQTAAALDSAEENTSYFTQIGPAPPEDMSNKDPISIVMRDLMNRASSAKQNEDAADASMLSHLAGQGDDSSIKCVSCLEMREPFLKGYCGHDLCRDCTREIYLGAIRDEELYPPRCCGRPFSPGFILQVLEYNEFRAFCEKALEYIAEKSVLRRANMLQIYPPAAIHGDHGVCPDCHQQTHLPCRALAHPGVDCPLDHTLQGVLAMADTQNWRRCFNCRTMVELEGGCNHITCRCGSEFCYVCGLVWKTCTCELWENDMIIEVANQAVNDQIAPYAGHEAREDLFNRVLEGLRHHEDVGCEHHRRSQWKFRNQGRLQYEICNDWLPEHIFVCSNCQMRVCNTCRRHRLR